ncbi:hypothetical protein BT67DRAFT_391284 [Trichocladium antarcticum]|uniref:Thymidylate kinase n=1 Tax=Trichocladium antarcticum TaxID=1450529 RepID=A0AAN6UEX9_9PEZI|nr:hypothetical protein BT67DRAFT_391284 [Trichocladium antarcticum]
MATLTRQPFAPLDGLRLQSLTSIKNRQNAIPNAPAKRKACDVLDMDDLENVDPMLFSKRAKGSTGDGNLTKAFFRPSSFILTKAAATIPSLAPAKPGSFGIPPTKSSTSRPRTILHPKSPAVQRPSPKSAVPSSLTAPAGRSPTRASRRMGILSRRRNQRLDSLSFGPGATVPFSLDAALKGTIPSYSGSLRGSGSGSGSGSSSGSSSSNAGSLLPADSKSSWFFDIHEDTPEQEMTNLLQHGTCTLDISSDEESERRAKRDRAEGRDKENIPPADDISQTSARSAGPVAAVDVDDMLAEKQRGPLAEMNVADYYAKGYDMTSIIIVPGDEEDVAAVVDEGEAPARLVEAVGLAPVAEDRVSEFQPCQAAVADVEAASVDDMMRNEDRAPEAAVSSPVQDAGETFELWESNSAKDECEAPAPPTPLSTADRLPLADTHCSVVIS